jgi:hypothetical protein
MRRTGWVARWTAAAALIALLAAATAVAAESARTNIYGYVMTDMGYNTEPVHLDWFDVQRPTKLNSFENEYGMDGNAFFSVRQTRFGLKSWLPTDLGELRTTFEFELFGTGVDAGQTTFRLRHAYGEMGKWGVGQTWSPFMDIDVFPNTLEYWGPNGMVFYRNVQLRYMPVQGDSRVTFALERPGASADQGVYSDKVDFSGVVARTPLPDFSAEARMGKPWGYLEVAGMLRYLEWDDTTPTPEDISGNVLGWGVNLSSNLKAGKASTLRLQLVYGEGIENYMNDAPVDLAPKSATGPIEGKAVPVTGIVAFLDHNWTEELSSSVGYSRCDIDNTDGQDPDAFKTGQYALANLLCTPAPNFMAGLETGWTQREHNSDGWKTDNYHVQLSFKYSFSFMTGGEK